MDEVRIRSKFMKGLIAKLIAQAIAKKLGRDVTISFDRLEIDCDEETIGLHMNVDARIPKDILSELLMTK